MHIVMGATGHVGSAVTHHLIEQGHPVTVVTRDADNAQPLADAGAAVTTCDARDPDALRAVLRHGHHAFLLNPPADPSTDTDAEERAGVEAILAALDGSGLDRVVALSTYGAQAGDALGDLSVMHELETGLRAQPIPAAVVRGAHFMSNWGRGAGPRTRPRRAAHVRPYRHRAADGRAQTISAAPGSACSPPTGHEVGQLDIRHVEGPDRYTPGDVAAAFSAALARPVKAGGIPRTQWERTFSELGFSAPAAWSYARMTAVTVDGAYEVPTRPERGTTTLAAYVHDLVRRRS